MPGLDAAVLKRIDQKLALARIQRDIRSDFVLAPHYNSIFVRASDELWDRTHELLSSGKYSPELALTVAVPKPRGFTRPGSILTPIDRLVYQVLADIVAPILEEQLDRSRTFSHVVVAADSDGHMFEQEHACWDRLQSALRHLADQGGCFVKADIANYFERIPQHHLVNLMVASGCATEVTRLLEEMLLAFQERDSFGIVQGLFPSDLFGNFYLSEIDAYCEIHGIPSARFVDDLYLRFETLPDSRHGLIRLIDQLRREGLHLNEFKSGIRTARELIKEETELDQLLSEILEEIKEEHQESKEITTAYGFVIDWELVDDEEKEDDENNDFETAAIQRLYGSIEEYPKQTDKIERFCLPFLRAEGSDIAIKRSMAGIVDRPHLTRLYLSYLSKFVSEDGTLRRRLEKLLEDPALISDYQRMYILGALTSAKSISKETVNTALRMLQQTQVGQEVRALAAIFAARHGTPQQRRSVRLSYEGEPSAYVRAAILYASRHFTVTERKICIKAWGAHNTTNRLISHALR
jgi:retron-type reverse transcriptase